MEWVQAPPGAGGATDYVRLSAVWQAPRTGPRMERPTETNPLLEIHALPAFSRIRAEHVVPAVERVLAENRAAIADLTGRAGGSDFEAIVVPLEELDDRLNRVWSPASHLNAVLDGEAMRAAYHECLPKLSDYAAELGQNEALHRAYRTLSEAPDFAAWPAERRKIVTDALRDFRLSGIELDAAGRARYRDLQQELSRLTSRFQDNVLDATHAWKKHITDESRLAGLPESARELAAQTARRDGLEGWLLTLEFPSYLPVVTYAEERDLRREVYEAYVTRASDLGPHAGRWDNTEVMDRILGLRHELAVLLGFGNYAEYSLATKMAHEPRRVLEFLGDLAARAVPRAREEFAELSEFARGRHGAAALEAWDTAYYAEKLRHERYEITQEELRPYFPEPRVLEGMFDLVGRLYGIRIRRIDGADVWHPDVRFYEIRGEDGSVRGHFYTDLYARPGKRGGAWMDECRNRKHLGADLQTPVAHLVCNFSPPVGDAPALLTHEEVLTLFHEFGHGLHHLLTRVDYPSVAGINGVPWDAVELPSQFMENWGWERAVLERIAVHYRTGAPLPESLYRRMLAARNFHSAMHMVRQLEFALFDFRIHLEHDPEAGPRIYETLAEVRRQVAVVPTAPFNRFAHSFTHIFAGGYAAGYYSYLWAEVLSADVFSAFEERGGIDAQTGRRLLATVLERGGSREPMDLFREFRGREPTIDALLRHTGLAGGASHGAGA